MRASEALMAGSLVIRPVAGTQWDGHGGGCAVGMILAAVGSNPNSWIEFQHPFAWLRNTAHISLPCEHQYAETLMGGGCRQSYRIHIISFADYIVHLFNYHVKTTVDWTIDRLAQWIDSVDPTEKETTQKEEVHEELASVVAR